MKLPYTIGFEITGIIPEYKEKTVKSLSIIENVPTDETMSLTIAYSCLISSELRKKYPKDFEVQKYIDGHCLEFPSPVFTSTEEMDKFYKFVKSQFDKFKIAPHHPITVCGGNHMHFGISNQVVIRNIMRDFTNRWYIPWVFTQPDDTESCCNIKNDLELCNLQNFVDEGGEFQKFTKTDIINKFYFQILTSDVPIDMLEISGLKDMCVGPNIKKGKGTFEFRCIEAPLSFSEFKDQQEFFIRYFNMARKLKNVSPVSFISNEQFQNITFSAAIVNFNALLDQLGLNPKRYIKYVERNLLPRWELGRKRY